MALINCPECGREVSDQADACPRCAYPIAKKLVVAAGGGLPAQVPADGEDDASAETPSAPGGEQTVWKGTPSQLVNVKPFLGGILAIAVIVAAPILLKKYMTLGNEVFYGLVLVVVPLAVMAWKWLVISCLRYELTTERIKLSTGVLSRKYETIELYRVKDIVPERPLIMRLCGLGHVIALTSDKSMPVVRFWAVRGSRKLSEDLRRLVEQRRVQRRVREMDID